MESPNLKGTAGTGAEHKQRIQQLGRQHLTFLVEVEQVTECVLASEELNVGKGAPTGTG